MLSRWSVRKLDEYVYEDPYEARGGTPESDMVMEVKEPIVKVAPVQPKPPEVVVSRTYGFQSSPPPRQRFAEPLSSQPAPPPSSQTYIAGPSTQPLPGPFGGWEWMVSSRGEAKMKKKRLGGFWKKKLKFMETAIIIICDIILQCVVQYQPCEFFWSASSARTN